MLDVDAVADRVERLAAALAAHVGPGDRVAYRLANRWETVALFHACGRVGAVAVPLPASLGPAQVEQRLAATEAVEDLIAGHPQVAEVVLVAYHPAEQAEAPAAVVVPADGHAPTLEDLHQHLRDQGTTEWYLPERLELVDALPRDASGKVDEKALRARIHDEG